MANRLLNSITFTLAITAVKAVIPSGRTLAECNAFANLFDNTCTVTNGVPEVLTSLSAHAGSTMSC